MISTDKYCSDCKYFRIRNEECECERHCRYPGYLQEACCRFVQRTEDDADMSLYMPKRAGLKGNKSNGEQPNEERCKAVGCRFFRKIMRNGYDTGRYGCFAKLKDRSRCVAIGRIKTCPKMKF